MTILLVLGAVVIVFAMVLARPQRALPLRPVTWAVVGAVAGGLFGLTVVTVTSSPDRYEYVDTLVGMSVGCCAIGTVVGLVVGAVRFVRSRHLAG